MYHALMLWCVCVRSDLSWWLTFREIRKAFLTFDSSHCKPTVVELYIVTRSLITNMCVLEFMDITVFIMNCEGGHKQGWRFVPWHVSQGCSIESNYDVRAVWNRSRLHFPIQTRHRRNNRRRCASSRKTTLTSRQTSHSHSYRCG